MKEYKCSACEYFFNSKDIYPYCPACFNESLEEIEEKNKEGLESHHILPRFMDNPKGLGKQILITKKTHDIIHGKIMNWLWEYVEDKESAIKYIELKTLEFIGGKNGV